MDTLKKLSKELSKRVEKELEKFKKYYKSAEDEINSTKYCSWLHDILSFQVNEKNFYVSSLKNFISSVIDFQKDRYEDRHQAWKVDLCFQEPSSAGYGDFIIHARGIDQNFNEFIFKTSVDLFNSGKGSIEDLKVFFGLFICTNFMDPTQRLDDLNAYANVKYGPFKISNPRPIISSNYGFCRRGYEDRIYLNFNCFDENSLNTLYGLYSIIDFEKDVTIREELIKNGIKNELLKFYESTYTDKEKCEIFEIIRKSESARNVLIQVFGNNLEDQYDFETLKNLLSKDSKKKRIKMNF